MIVVGSVSVGATLIRLVKAFNYTIRPCGAECCHAVRKWSSSAGRDPITLLGGASVLEAIPLYAFLVLCDLKKHQLFNSVSDQDTDQDVTKKILDFCEVERSKREICEHLGFSNLTYDLLGDGSIQLINIPGHADGLFAVKVKNEEGKFVLLFSDGGDARKSWEQQITSGIAADKQAQKRSLAWIREQSLDPDCVESLANHDPDIRPHVIEL